ncbi:MAG: RNA 2',3'-cyclic phosphodiesterase [Acidimicrobiia bacterium]
MVGTVGRVFVAVPLPTEVRMALADRTSILAIPGRLVPLENWHLTLRFLGAVGEITYERFLSGLSLIEDVPSFSIRLGAFGGFPNERKASVMWAGVVEGAEELRRLNEIAEEAAQTAGLEPDDRPYRPHLTLSRIRPPEDIGRLTTETLDLRWSCHEIVVYESRLSGGGVSYEPLEMFSMLR